MIEIITVISLSMGFIIADIAILVLLDAEKSDIICLTLGQLCGIWALFFVHNYL